MGLPELDPHLSGALPVLHHRKREQILVLDDGKSDHYAGNNIKLALTILVLSILLPPVQDAI